MSGRRNFPDVIFVASGVKQYIYNYTWTLTQVIVIGFCNVFMNNLQKLAAWQQLYDVENEFWVFFACRLKIVIS